MAWHGQGMKRVVRGGLQRALSKSFTKRASAVSPASYSRNSASISLPAARVQACAALPCSSCTACRQGKRFALGARTQGLSGARAHCEACKFTVKLSSLHWQ